MAPKVASTRGKARAVDKGKVDEVCVDPFEGGTNAPSFTPAHRSRLPSIIVLSKEGREEYDIPPGASITIGRSRECDVQIDQKSISRRHAVIHDSAPLEVEDLGSSNGTWLDGERLQKGRRVRLSSLSYLELGSVVVIVNGGWSSGRRTANGIDAPTPIASVPGGPKNFSIKVVREYIDLVAKSSISVLIAGETGAGKEVAAEAIHRKSARANKPFLGINCAAFPDTLLESELFGFDAGAFSGAARTKRGLLETADGGTVFFDELGEMPLQVQAKLLRVLETREVTRLGGTRARAIDVRFLAATNRDLQALVSAGSFRGDLYFRLNGFFIGIPPLRERIDELPDLVSTFVRAACAEAGRSELRVSDEAWDSLKSYAWPGNVRQLKNVMERAVLLCRGEIIKPSHLALEHDTGAADTREPKEADAKEPKEAPPAVQLETPLDALSGVRPLLASQRKIILETLEKCAGNQSAAARALGISRTTLLKRLDTFEVPRPRPKKRKRS